MKIKVKMHSKSIGISIKLELFFFLPKNIIVYGKCLKQEKGISVNSRVKHIVMITLVVFNISANSSTVMVINI